MNQFENGLRHSVRVMLDYVGERPSCNHGPMLLFERSSETGKKFFACSAYRDRKLCPSYVLETDWERDSKKTKVRQPNPLLSKSNSLDIIRENLLEKEVAKNKGFCYSCGEIFLEKKRHLNHKITSNVKDYLLHHPSQLLDPLDHSKKEAQYFFSDNSINVISSLIEDVKVSHVLCIACPSIFEKLKSNGSTKCIMLDIDVRFRQFYTTSDFLLYNMFNHHFFDGEKGVSVYEQFLKDGNNSLAIVMDPPFGGKVEIISHTLKAIDADYKRLNGAANAVETSKFWIFPYFMESQIQSELSDFAMLDYKIEYTNHTQFQKGPKGRKQGSPVRIFTNANLEQLRLPTSEGYSYCTICKKWISSENRHCTYCNSCTSKDGRTYVHCVKCKRCVKPTWTHCHKCNRCALADHPCELFKQQSLNEIPQPKKRKMNDHEVKIISTSSKWIVT